VFVRLITARREEAETLGIVVEDRWLPVSALLDGRGPRTMAELVADGDDDVARLRRVVADGAHVQERGLPLAETRVRAPLARPGKIVAIGRNYREHLNEEGADRPSAPLMFSKWPSCVIGQGDDIRWDPALSSQVDYEAELAVVIGRRARRVSEADALDHVFGYTCLNDVTARDVQFGDGQWVRGKSLDTFAPMGPAIVTADEIGDPQTLDIACSVNGETRQASNTSQMYFGVAAIVSYASQSFTLEPGDVIATGTPGGVGHFREPPLYLTDGDRVVVEIERIGRLENTCRFDRAGAPA
jgi:2-keto-4-pentenoate hydratase/2-oxohepta-3-ene-1,7-dioic acid hydratase in catechol pathway